MFPAPLQIVCGWIGQATIRIIQNVPDETLSLGRGPG